MLTVTNLSCKWGERLIWQNIEFELAPGQLMQVMGSNGCGKTSLLRILTGLAPAHSGSIYWRGMTISHQGSDYKQQVYYLGHRLAVKNELTVRENVQFSLGRSSQKCLLLALEKAGLLEHSEHFGYQLSQGQKQRVALARLLLSAASIWMLDEPFSGLDSEMIENLQHIFADYVERGGIIILTTHRPLTLAALTARSMKLTLS